MKEFDKYQKKNTKTEKKKTHYFWSQGKKYIKTYQLTYA